MKSYSKYFNAFTLAEMMVVLLIMSIVLACLAPAMTTKMKADQNIQTSPWKWAQNNIDTYFSTGSNQAAMIGQNEKAETDNAKLIINNSTNLDDMILFKNGNDVLGRLRMAHATPNSLDILLGTLSEGHNLGPSAVGIGDGLTASAPDTIAIGTGASALAPDTIAIGHGASATGGDNASSIALGNNASASANNSIAIGTNVQSIGNSALVIGNSLSASGGYSLAIGSDSKALGDYDIAIGYMAMGGNTTDENNSTPHSNVAIGYQALLNTEGSNNTAIGANACANVKGSNKTCIGANSGPANDHAWASESDTTERIFIGSKSEFNNAPAVLEVHNSSSTRDYRDGNQRNETSVVVNGNLIVKGFVFSSLWSKGESDIVAFYGRDGEQMEYFGTTQNSTSMVGYYGTDANGNFIDFNNNAIGVSSDRRLKYVGKENTDGLAKLRQLKIFNYTFKKDETKTPRVGVMAQDLQKIFPNAVKKGVDGFLTIRMEDMFYAVINAIKELDARVTALEKENKLLKEQNKALDARLKALEAKIK